jgi:hypothetical protein
MSELISIIAVLVIVVISVAAMYFKWSNERLRKELEEWDAGQRESIDDMVRRIQESRQARYGQEPVDPTRRTDFE